MATNPEYANEPGYDSNGHEIIGGSAIDSNGDPAVGVVVDSITSWSGAGIGSAPAPSSSTRMYGFDLDGIISAQMYFWNGTSWVTMTGITHLTFLGG